jgi:hypothetical protein
MALSGMNSREKTLIAVLAVIIILALVGIGVLIAKLVVDGGAEEQAGGITPVATTLAATPEPTATLVETPALEAEEETPLPTPAGAEPVRVTQAESPAPLLPVLITNQALHAGHHYRVEIAAADGSAVAIKGSWSQSAKGAGAQIEVTGPESFEGKTPFSLEVKPPLDNPTSWSITVSAGPQDLLGQPPKLVLTILDVSGE